MWVYATNEGYTLRAHTNVRQNMSGTRAALANPIQLVACGDVLLLREREMVETAWSFPRHDAGTGVVIVAGPFLLC